jgi:phosphate-selective porin OprO/OprP
VIQVFVPLDGMQISDMNAESPHPTFLTSVKLQPSARLLYWLLAGCLACAGPASAATATDTTLTPVQVAQQPEANPGGSTASPATAQQPEAAATQQAPRVTPVADEESYMLKDLHSEALMYQGKYFIFRPIIALVGDYTSFDQDAASLEQVGEQEDTQDLRAARFGFYLRPKTGRAWEFFTAADYVERRTRDDDTFQLYDLRLRLAVGEVSLDIGKQKQPFSFEMGGLSILYPNQERILSPFFVTRSVGIRALGQAAGDRMTWSVGWFNDWIEADSSFSETGNDYVGRMTGLLYAPSDSNNYLHMGLGFRVAGPDSDLYRMSGRPESNVADKYLDTGNFTADHVTQLGIDLAWQHGPLLLVGEHMQAQAQSTENGNPHFSGNYLMLAWMLTGESRPYIRSIGTFGPVKPAARTGAFELVTRYSYVDLNDGLIQGGELHKWHFGLNWWISRQWKTGISWGDADLTKEGLEGNTTMLLLRMQWAY